MLPPDLFHLESLLLGGNQLPSLRLPKGLTNLTGLFLTSNQLTSLTLPPDTTRLTALSFLNNPLTTLVLSETLATSTNLTVNTTETVATLPGDGVSVFAYPQAIQLIRFRQPLGALQFGIIGPPGTYTVLASTNLAAWSELGVTTNQLGAVVFTDGTARLSPQKFYRVYLPGL